MISLRKAENRDCNDLFKWRNDHRIRKWFFNTDKVSLANHRKWFNKNKNNVLIAENEHKVMLGQFRWKVESYISVSVNLDPRFLDKGIGREIIKQGTNKLQRIYSKKIVAEILDKNIASRKAFTKAGYKYSHRVYIKREE